MGGEAGRLAAGQRGAPQVAGVDEDDRVGGDIGVAQQFGAGEIVGLSARGQRQEGEQGYQRRGRGRERGFG